AIVVTHQPHKQTCLRVREPMERIGTSQLLAANSSKLARDRTSTDLAIWTGRAPSTYGHSIYAQISIANSPLRTLLQTALQGGHCSRALTRLLTERGRRKVTGTIANVRRNRQLKSGEALDEEGEEPRVNGRNRREDPEPVVNGRDGERRRTSRVVSGQSTHTVQVVEETSFAAESSFTRAPLNTRIVGRQAGLSPAHASKGKGKEREVEAASLKGVPLEVQEALVLEDLLYVLMGIPGTYITVHPSYDPEVSGDGVQYAANPSLDPSLRDLVQRILPLATYYTAICAFIENRSALECGLVNHALCASIREMLNKDYLTLLAQLEHQFNTAPAFSLQKLWFYVHPTLHTLSLIWSLTDELTKADSSGDDNEDESDEEVDEIDAIDEELGLAIGKKGKLKALDALDDAGIIKGGEVVAVLWERVTNMSGDPSAHELYLTLFRQASAPYADMLQRWITTGQLKDPHQEFMVRESKDITRQILDRDHTDDYWERRYV
ncbi:hypothetical protein FRC01_012701, partial [Tulasnella sp. 417]